MIRLATLIEAFEAALLARYGNRLTAQQRRALAALKGCRRAASARMQLECSDCAQPLVVPHSCGHRHCPHCQHHASQQWIERQLARRVPAPYFLLTFTLPAQWRALAAAHPATLYDALMRCAWQTLRRFAANDRQLRGEAGAIAVLHTHSRRLDYHPHVHVLMPAGALDAERRRWRTKRPAHAQGGYLFNGKALASVFRAKMLAALDAAGLARPAGTPKQWVAHCKHVGGGAKALVYLGRYLYRGVIREHDILACEQGQVRFRYRHARSGKRETRTLAERTSCGWCCSTCSPRDFAARATSASCTPIASGSSPCCRLCSNSRARTSPPARGHARPGAARPVGHRW